MQKPIVIYNFFTSNLDNKIINNSNKIKLNQNSELTLIEYNICEKSKFIKNTFEKVDLDKNSVMKHIMIQKTKSNGYFYKNISIHRNITQVIKILYLVQDLSLIKLKLTLI